MLIIYFDTNIYSLISSNKADTSILELYHRADNDFLFLYSQAHLNDLSNDFTDKKFGDLEIIQLFANNNFLRQDQLSNRIEILNVFPKEAFIRFAEHKQSSAEFLTDPLMPTGIDVIDNYIDFYKSQIVDLGPDVEKQLNDENHPEYREMYNEIGIYKRKYEMDEWIKIVAKMMDRFENDDSLIKLVRRKSKQNLEVEKLNIRIGDINFDENLSKSKLGKTYQEFVNHQVSMLPGNGDSLYNRFVTGYNIINFFGLDYEKNKKVKFKNSINDGQHCYYAGLSDILVSNDVGLINKSKFIYSFYGINTKVLSLDEFSYFIKEYKIRSIKDESQFHSLLEFDRQNSLIIVPRRPIITEMQHEEVRSLTDDYLGYFNRLSEVGMVSSDEDELVLFKDQFRVNRIVFYKEFDYLIKSLNSIFYHNHELLSSIDLESISDGNWDGRIWETANGTYWLRHNPKTGRIVLQINAIKN